jgi:CBS domain-containing protein
MAATARDAMTTDVITVGPSTLLADVARMFSEDRISGAPVVDDGERLVGIVSRTDVITGLLAAADGTTPEMRSLLGIGETEEDEPEDGGDVPEPEGSQGAVVEDVMDGDPTTVAPDTPLVEVARRMARERLHRVVVTEDGRVVGILTSIDLLERFPAAAKAAEAARAARPAAKAKKAAARRPAATGGKSKGRPKAKGKAARGARGKVRTRR